MKPVLVLFKNQHKGGMRDCCCSEYIALVQQQARRISNVNIHVTFNVILKNYKIKRFKSWTVKSWKTDKLKI